jgi:hypothetical protein
MPPPRRARPPTLPGLTAAPAPSEKPKKRRREPTVQVIYLSARRGLGEVLPSEREDLGTRHHTKNVGAEVVLPEASPERRAGERERGAAEKGSDRAARRAGQSDRSEKPRETPSSPAPRGATENGGGRESDDPPTIAGTVAWVLFVLALLVAAIAMLAALPPIG